mmetsp:Transcript_25449/g.55932  ORF Transcript_25449/g.55932 Transcript_25449/m.55932 type:complete len:152 (+) Transcript_25449:140-595(+)
MNENQNVHVRNGRSTSRVLNRPGGTCQITLGGYTEAELKRMKEIREAKANGSVATNTTANANNGTENEKKAATNENPAPEPVEAKEASTIPEKTTMKTYASSALSSARTNTRVSSNAFASSSTTNSFNVLTDRPTSKVSNPPGGRTNFRLG